MHYFIIGVKKERHSNGKIQANINNEVGRQVIFFLFHVSILVNFFVSMNCFSKTKICFKK